MTLTEFLLARIAEDEAVARAAIVGGYERWEYDGGWSVGQPYAEACEGSGLGKEPLAHIALHDPARVLAECAAKRGIVALHSAELGQHPDFCGHDLRALPCPTLRLLARPYAEHPDYDEAWWL